MAKEAVQSGGQCSRSTGTGTGTGAGAGAAAAADADADAGADDDADADAEAEAEADIGTRHAARGTRHAARGTPDPVCTKHHNRSEAYRCAQIDSAINFSFSAPSTAAAFVIWHA